MRVGAEAKAGSPGESLWAWVPAGWSDVAKVAGPVWRRTGRRGGGLRGQVAEDSRGDTPVCAKRWDVGVTTVGHSD